MNLKEYFSPKTNLNPKRSRARLRVLLFILAFAILLPMGLLVEQTYSQLEKEAFYLQKNTALGLYAEIDQKVAEIMRLEDERPFEHYLFSFIETEKSVDFVNFSPLANLPLITSTPGVIGYFQIEPNGQMTSPILPRTPVEAQVYRFSREDLARRVGLLEKMKVVIQERPHFFEEISNRPITDKTKSPSLDIERFKKNRRLEELGLAQEEMGTRLSDITFDEGSPEEEVSPAAPKPPPKPLRNRPTKTNPVHLLEEELLARQLFKSELPHSRNFFSRELESQLFATKSSPRKAPPLFTTPLSFEEENGSATSELDPLRFQLLPSGDMVFYRKAFKNGQRYIQGFLVDLNAFLRLVFESSFRRSSLAKSSQMLVAFDGYILGRYSTYDTKDSFRNNMSTKNPEYKLLRSTLSAPFQLFEVLFTVKDLPSSPAKRVVDLLTLVVLLILGVGLYLIYRLAINQLEFAKQRGDFVSAISHELKTPLTSIRMYGEMLRDGWVHDEEKKKSYYDFIFFESERLSRLINNVLYLAKYNNSENPVALQSFSPHQMLELICSKIAPAVNAANFNLEIVENEADKLKSLNCQFNADADAMAQIALNLTDNAIKFSKKSGSAKIQVGYQVVGAPGDKVIFFVRDFGPGVPKDQREKIFELFYRAGDEMTRTTPGTGIGLALVRQLGDSMNAEVKMRNMSPGAEFRVEFKLEALTHTAPYQESSVHP